MQNRFVFILIPSFFMGINACAQNKGIDSVASASRMYYQMEHVYIHCDKYSCLAGDTIWFKGYIFAGAFPSTLSTNLYVDLFSDKGQSIQKNEFPILGSQAIGQLSMPDSLPSGSYWIRAYTKYQTNFDLPNFFMIPIRVFHDQDSKNVKYSTREKQQIVENSAIVDLHVDTLDSGPLGYNSWVVNLKDSVLYHCSVSVTDADKTTEPPIWLKRPDIINSSDYIPRFMKMDTNFLEWRGTASKAYSKKLIRKDNLMILLVKDSTILRQMVIPVDSVGQFKLSHLFFFDRAALQFQLNQQDDYADGPAKNVKLVLDEFSSPAFQIPNGWVTKDTLIKIDSYNIRKSITNYPRGRQLKEVQIKGWKIQRKELDHHYATGAFSQPAMYSFDLRTDKRWNNLGSYLRANLPGFQSGTSPMDLPTIDGHPLLFYVDEQLKLWYELDAYKFVEIAYIKAFESDFIGDDPFTKWLTNCSGFSLGGGAIKSRSQPTPMIISIYTRKGKDTRAGWPGLNSISITGYTSIGRFQQKDEDPITLFWEPLEDAYSFRIRFHNNTHTKQFRLTLTGVNDNGKAINYTKFIPENN